jgi:hypothetical protein
MCVIFISYSWKNKIIADHLDVIFHSKGIVLQRDVRDINYKDSIKEYMKKVRNADFCLMLLSESYLKSINCMYEVLEFIKEENYKNKVLPILIGGLKIFSAIERSSYTKYWQDKYNEVDNSRKELDSLNQADIIQELKMIENIKRNISDFLAIISDMKLVFSKNDVSINDFNTIYKIVNPDYNENGKFENLNGYFVANLPQSINYNIFMWWEVESNGYTQDIRESKIFTQDEVEEMFIKDEYSEWDNKKYVAVPIEIVSKFDQNIVPYIYTFIDIIKKNSDKTYGNKRLSLTKEEVKEYY